MQLMCISRMRIHQKRSRILKEQPCFFTRYYIYTYLYNIATPSMRTNCVAIVSLFRIGTMNLWALMGKKQIK